MQALIAAAGHSCWTLDLPGFGASPPPPRPWSVADYAAFVEGLMHQCGLAEVALVGHSFGGRIAIRLASGDSRRVRLRHLTLTGSAGLREPLKARQRALIALAGTGRRLLETPPLRGLEPLARAALYRVIGPRDYTRARGVMRETMRLVIEEDLSDRLREISVPVLLVWGEADRVTPLTTGRRMASLVPSARFEVVPGGTHRLPYESPELFAALVLGALAGGGVTGSPS